MNSTSVTAHKSPLRRFSHLSLLTFLLLAFMFAGTRAYNDFRSHRLQQNFAVIPHPASSKFIGRTTKVGLFGNGNHCDFLVAELRSYSGNPKATQNFYQGTRLPVPNVEDNDYDDVKNGTEPVAVDLLPSPLPPKYRWNFANKWDLSAFAGQKNLYIVYILNVGKSYGWETFCDWRCI